MKIIAVGRNYVDHAKELNNPVPTTPVIFMKPDTALLKDNKDFYYPEFSKDVHYEVELVIRICNEGKHVSPKFAHKYYDAIGLGIDFTARDIQAQHKDKGLPWELAKAFDHSAVISPLIPKEEFSDFKNIAFSMQKNAEVVQAGNTADMIFDFETLIVFVSKYITLRKGDLIYTGTPVGVGPIAIGDKFDGFIGERPMFSCSIK
ncbi:fumarylacetoacetate hydrolase family protein [Sphingobacterium deserti]|uniref:2-hydroxyhepta-2,4-diene-1,7-dioate isomerase n=1 Tax=Sphingobacterium deserti TaxID=1229276 RepID=A0A0B8T1P1_9SPHI|nr:fumarylacetoacetate hydrolase family protein [Sphingobacterium deserti]KGE15032.1 2-hydroxyhepta-2,4-diene-1,7-dioate isomerase [Sphingobacterium deserti]